MQKNHRGRTASGLFLFLAAALLQEPAAARGTIAHGVNSGAGGFFFVSIDLDTAALQSIAPLSFDTDGLAYNPAGELYAVDNQNDRLVRLDPTTGATIGTLGSFLPALQIEGLAFHPITGQAFASDNTRLWTIDMVTGAATLIGDSSVSGMASLAFNASGGSLYFLSCHDQNLYTINPGTAVATLIGATGLNCPLGLTLRTDNDKMYTVDWAGGQAMGLYEVNLTNASVTFVGTMAGGFQIEGIAAPLTNNQLGQGCAGSGGFVPKLSSTPSNPPAGTQLNLAIDEGLGGASALLFFGAGSTQIPMGGACSLNIAPLFPLMLQLPLSSTGPGNGHATIAGVVPIGAAGASFALQVFVVDPNVPKGFSNTNGVLISVQ